MSLFAKKQSYLGVDLGTASIKVVELANVGGLARLVTYGFAELPVEEIKFNVHDKIDRSAKTLEQICKQARVTSRKAVAALPTFSVFSSVLTLPVMSEKEVGQALAYEAKKIIPLPLDEMILDWKILKKLAIKNKPESIRPESGRGEKGIRVLLTAAPKNLVKQYLDIFSTANIELLSLETEAFALGRSLLSGEASVVLVVDIGALTTDIVVIEDHIPVFNRSIDMGGVTVTKAISASLNIDQNRAEQFKRDVGIVREGVAGTTGVPNTIKESISPVINEIKYSLSLYQNDSNSRIEKIIITGGSAFLPNLAEYLEGIFQLKVVVGDPWAQVAYPMELKGVLEEIAPRFVTAIGLALREIHK
ncbi:MAG: type IV pilus assembly protein PilM [Patescibacteria group bacterium]